MRPFGRALLAAWMIGVAAAPQGAAAVPLEGASAAPARLSSFLAYDPAWLPGTNRLAFLGNRASGEPLNVLVWDPASNRMARASAQPGRRHSLLVSPSGDWAYVERTSTAASPAPVALWAMDPAFLRASPEQGPETLFWQSGQGGAPRVLLDRTWLAPHNLVFSPDATRLALVTLDRRGFRRLALLDVASGQLSLIELDDDYENLQLIGWTGPRDVLLRATDPRGIGRLLEVGRGGLRAWPDAEGAVMSPTRRSLLVRDQVGTLYVRKIDGTGWVVSPGVGAYAWGPTGDRIYAGVGRDLVELDLRGKVLRRWSGLARMGLGQVCVSPNGRYIAYGADFGLSVLTVKP